MKLTKREQQLYDTIAGAGAKGMSRKEIDSALRAIIQQETRNPKAKVGTSTVAQRLGRLRALGVISSKIDGKLATYTAAK